MCSRVAERGDPVDESAVLLNTIKQISSYTKKQVITFRNYPDKKDEVVENLKNVFSADSESWKRVIDENKFRETFSKDLGKRNLKVLRRLLLELDEQHYISVDFGIE